MATAAAEEINAQGTAKVSVLIDNDNKYYVNGHQVGASQIASEVDAC